MSGTEACPQGRGDTPAVPGEWLVLNQPNPPREGIWQQDIRVILRHFAVKLMQRNLKEKHKIHNPEPPVSLGQENSPLDLVINVELLGNKYIYSRFNAYMEESN